MNYKKIVFATNNAHKLAEIREMLAGSGIDILSLADIGCHDDIPETAPTIEGNALQKAKYIFDKYHTACFADDTGLEVRALDGAPGVYSARYAGGQGHDSEANMAKLLGEMRPFTDRKARFRTAICLILETASQPVTFEGVVNGQITTERHGSEGFGYDPIFQPDGYTETFAQLGHEVKNKISHRALAVGKLVEYLKGKARE